MAVVSAVATIHFHRISVQSNWARANAQIVAACASIGLISTDTAEGDFGRIWRATVEGLEVLRGGSV